jgi:hypothetical protein
MREDPRDILRYSNTLRTIPVTVLAAANSVWPIEPRATIWHANPLGPIHGWPETLKAAVQVMMSSRFPMFIWWGPQLINLYNDAHVPMLGKKHPAASGQPAAEVWSEIWDVVLAGRVETILKKSVASEGETYSRTPGAASRNSAAPGIKPCFTSLNFGEMASVGMASHLPFSAHSRFLILVYFKKGFRECENRSSLR